MRFRGGDARLGQDRAVRPVPRELERVADRADAQRGSRQGAEKQVRCPVGGCPERGALGGADAGGAYREEGARGRPQGCSEQALRAGEGSFLQKILLLTVHGADSVRARHDRARRGGQAVPP